MGTNKELDEKTQKLVGTSLSFDEVYEDLNNTSPLQMSKKLIEYELYDQQSSIEIMEKIYEEFESGGDVVDSLVTPVFLNICDGLIKHPKLGLAKSGITATRLVGEIKHFNYGDVHSSKRDIVKDKVNLDEHTLEFSKRLSQNDIKYQRKDFEDKKNLKDYRNKSFDDKRIMKSELEVNENGSSRRLYKETKDSELQKKIKTGKKTKHMHNVDHTVPLKDIQKEFGHYLAISDSDIKNIANNDINFDIISENLNKIKGQKTWTTLKEEKNELYNLKQKEKDIGLTNDDKKRLNDLSKLDDITDATISNALVREAEARKHIEESLKIAESNKNVANNLLNNKNDAVKKIYTEAKDKAMDDSRNQAMGEVIILLIKPIYYEFSDIFTNGMIADLNTDSKIEAFKIRMTRVKEYVVNNLNGSFMDILKGFLQNFVTMIINGIVNAFVGLLKKILQVISEGFMSIVEAIKIMMKPSEELSAGQKADAITKLLATTVITFLGAYFEETILGFMNGTPLEFLKDVIMIMLTGIASTVVVWLLDQADLFSVKDEKRLARVKEIFTLRIENIKNNTDIFEKTSIAVLAKQKLQFKKVIENMNHAIDNNLNVNDSVYQVADFMQIELQVKTTDDFVQMLIANKTLTI